MRMVSFQIIVAISNPPPKPDTSVPRTFNPKPTSLPGFRGPAPRRFEIHIITEHTIFNSLNQFIVLTADPIFVFTLFIFSDAKPRLTFIPTSVQRSVQKPSTSSNGTNGGDTSTPKSNDYFRQLLNKK